MIIYKFRQSDRVFAGAVEVPDSPTIPPFHTWSAPPEQDGFHAVMKDGWVLVEGPVPDEFIPPPEPIPEPPPPPPPEPEPDYAEIARKERNAKLAACDWTQLADSPVDKEAWAQYRQALRDVPQQENFPFDIVWPQEPA